MKIEERGVTNGEEIRLTLLVITSSSSHALMINRKSFVNLEKAWNDKHLREGRGERERERGRSRGRKEGKRERERRESVISLSSIKFPVNYHLWGKKERKK